MDRHPLGLGQEQLFFLDELSPGNPTYNVCQAFRLSGPVDLSALETSASVVVARHEALRATFHSDEHGPYQVIHAPTPVRIDPVDVSGTSATPNAVADATESLIQQILVDEAERPFDLGAGPLYRFRLFKVGEHDHVLVIAIHHMVIDGWASSLLCREMSTIYEAVHAGHGVPELPTPVSYLDVVAGQRGQRGVLDDDLRYWETRLAGLPILEVPADWPRPAVPSHLGALVSLDLSATLRRDLTITATQHGVSLLMLLTTGVAAVLSRYSGQDDLAIGLSMLGRTEPEHEKVVGFFTNMVVLRADASGNPSIANFVGRIADSMLDAYDHHTAPFGMVVERVRPTRDASRNPLFQVCVQLLGEQNSGNDLVLAGTDTTPVRMPVTRSRFDLTFNFVESADGLKLEIEYATDLYERWRMESLLEHVERALIGVCLDPASQQLSDLSLLSEADQARLLAAGGSVATGYPPVPVHVAVADTARRQPSAVALECRDQQLSYAELDHRAQCLAAWLRAAGIGHESLVAITMDRDIDAIVALLAVMKSGGAYVVLDPRHPADRLAYMLADSAATVVLTTAELADRVPATDGVTVIHVDRQWPEIAAGAQPERWPELATRDSLVYALYTSGSTGRPKGVLLEHRALLSFAYAYSQAFDLGPGDRMLQFSALSFDMSHGEIFAGLVSGATLVLVPVEDGTPDGISAMIADREVTFVSLSPAMLALVNAGPYPHLRKIQSGGDVLPAETVNRWNQPHRRMINMYGPTETAVACTGHVCDSSRPYQTAPPIGVALRDRRMYVVDRWDRLVPRGVPGELLIGGDEGVARGYLNSPDLTEARFVADPFHPDSRVYRSGDLVRWTAGWELEFLGRIDAQVKINGIRIEVEEIEAVLLKHPGVAMAAVAAHPDPAGGKRLVGYVAPVDGDELTVRMVRGYLGEHLPEYMVPTAWVFMDRLPLTTARKVDRAALHAPDPGELQADEEFIAPVTPTEVAIAEAFAEVLGRDRVAAEDNLFDLGGGSLHAMRVVSRLNKSFGIRLNLRVLYGSATVRALGKLVDELVDESTATARSGR